MHISFKRSVHGQRISLLRDQYMDNEYLFHSWSNKAFKGIVVNQKYHAQFLQLNITAMFLFKLKIHVNMFKKCTAVSERNINKTHCPAREGRHTTPFFVRPQITLQIQHYFFLTHLVSSRIVYIIFLSTLNYLIRILNHI